MPVKPMRLPKRVDVVGAVYQTQLEDRPLRNDLLDDRPLGGCCSVPQRTIAIHLHGHPDRTRMIYTHEVLHAIDCETTDAESTLPEKEVFRLARGLHYVLSHNPEFLRMYAKDKN